MQSINIKGTEYIPVHERIKYFRTNFKDYRIKTDIIKIGETGIIFKALIINPEGKIVSTGHAYEKQGTSFINKTSHIENCETSAIGRALGIFGIGIDASVASADEIANAINQQNIRPAKQTPKEYGAPY